MAIRKEGEAEQAEVLRGREANVLHDHIEKTGKTSLSRFSGSEMDELNRDLETARREDEEEQRKLLEELEQAKAEKEAEEAKEEKPSPRAGKKPADPKV